MGEEYTAKSFKSGNSVAIRIPAALGVEPNCEWRVEKRDGDLIFHRKEKPARKLDVDKFWGKAKGMIHVPEPRQDFDPRSGSRRSKP